MNIKFIASAVVVAAIGALLSVSSARASVIYDWSFSDSTDSGSGTFTTGTVWTATGVAISGISGTVDGHAITGLSSFAGADNKLYSAAPHMSLGGISFATSVNTFNLENFGGVELIKFSTDPSGIDTGGVPITFSIAQAVPEPSTWAMMILGFMGVGFLAYRRKTTHAFRLA